VKVKHPMYRERKQVSSHIQVIKNFFRFHPACELWPCFVAPCPPALLRRDSNCTAVRTFGLEGVVSCCEVCATVNPCPPTLSGPLSISTRSGEHHVN
jgi:hypothetical protein